MSAADQFAEFYDTHRVVDQRDYYRRRAARYRSTGDRIAAVVRVMLAGSALCGFLIAVDAGGSGIGAASSLLAASSALLTGWSDLIGYRVNAAHYERTVDELEGLRSGRPQPRVVVTDGQPTELDDIGDYVAAVEAVLAGEVKEWSNRWGAEVKAPSRFTPPSG